MRLCRPLAVAAACLVGAAACSTPPPATVGSPMPRFELPARDGSTLSSRSLADRPAVIAFWATWCQPCLADIPVLAELVAEDGLAVVSVSLDDGGWRVVEPFLEEHPPVGTVVLGNEETFRSFGGFTIPYTVVVDGEQIVRAIFRGPISRADVLASLAP